MLLLRKNGKLPCYSVSLIFFASFTRVLLFRLRVGVLEIVSERITFSSCSAFLFSQWIYEHEQLTNFPLHRCYDGVGEWKNGTADKTGKFVSANLDFGATRRF